MVRKRNKLLILTDDAGAYKKLIQGLELPNLDIVAAETPADAEKDVRDSNIILGAPAMISRVLDEAGHLQWVQSSWAGVNELVQPSMRTDYLLTGVKGIFGPMMSEYVFGYILALERHLMALHAEQSKHQWTPMPFQILQGRLIGICGLGSIGRHIAETARHFGMKVWGYKRTPAQLAEVDRLFTEKEFKEFLASPEYIVSILPDTPNTRHLFYDDTFAIMNKKAVLINVGRGSVVSETALLTALNKNQIRGAVLDVFEKEPLPEDSPLWGNPKVVVTPHISSVAFPEDIVPIFAENYRFYITNQPLKYIITFSKGY